MKDISKRNLRKKLTSEVFTPLSTVDEMLDKLPSEVFLDPSKTFCDNSAGNGNFLIQVLQRKLDQGHDPLQALSTIYGVELMPDNVLEMKERLLSLIPAKLYKKAEEIVNRNIICNNSLTWDFENWCSTEHKSKVLF